MANTQRSLAHLWIESLSGDSIVGVVELRATASVLHEGRVKNVLADQHGAKCVVVSYRQSGVKEPTTTVFNNEGLKYDDASSWVEPSIRITPWTSVDAGIAVKREVEEAFQEIIDFEQERVVYNLGDLNTDECGALRDLLWRISQRRQTTIENAVPA